MTYAEREKFEDDLADLVRRAEKMIDGPYQPDWSPAKSEECEVVEKMDCVIAVLDIPGKEAEEIRVSVVGEEIRIEGPDLHIKTQLPCRVDPAGLGSDYRNGILSVRIMKP